MKGLGLEGPTRKFLRDQLWLIDGYIPLLPMGTTMLTIRENVTVVGRGCIISRYISV